MFMQLCRVKNKNQESKNGGIESDNLKTGAIAKHWLDVKTIGVVLDGCLNRKVL